MLHTVSLNLLGSSPDRCARGSANRLNAVIVSTTQLGSLETTPLLWTAGCRSTHVCIMMLLYRRYSMGRPIAVAVRSDFN